MTVINNRNIFSVINNRKYFSDFLHCFEFKDDVGVSTTISYNKKNLTIRVTKFSRNSNMVVLFILG